MSAAVRDVKSPWLPAPGGAGSLLLEGPAGKIETWVAVPPEPAKGFAVVCHPHPLQGGALSNKVTYALAAAALKCGLIAVRFNFRGVGKSTGSYDEGRGETEDALAVVAWMRERLPQAGLLLAGFSFGAWIALKAAVRAQPALLITVAPPFTLSRNARPLSFSRTAGEGGTARGASGGVRASEYAEQPPRPAVPWLMVQSRDDEIVSYEETQRVLTRYRPPPEQVTLEGAGHFFHGRLGDVEAATTGFIRKHWSTE
ncbi:MAG: hypothetical protein L0Y32_03830 [Nevskiales bacterium]|nr:hypothetical protein [Nevskiales bacterium]